MQDLISRKAAIEAVHKTIYGLFDIVDDDSEEPFTKEEERLLVINKAITTRIKSLPSAQPEVIRCKNCRWWDKYNEKHGYCMAAKHGFMSSHWEISIYRTYDEEFFCADAEPKEKEGGDNEAD